MAHNGFYYDFPLLRAELLAACANSDLESVICADSLVGFRALYKRRFEAARRDREVTEAARLMADGQFEDDFDFMEVDDDIGSNGVSARNKNGNPYLQNSQLKVTNSCHEW